MKPTHIALLAVAFFAFLVLSGAFYTVPQTEQVIITQFGKPTGGPITSAGLHMKTPFIQDVHRIEKRILEWDGPAAEMPTKDKLYIIVDAFARWRISDPLQYFLRLKDPRSARSRLDDILGSEMRNTIARHDLVEVVRTTKDRKAAAAEALGEGASISSLPAIQLGRVTLEKEVLEAAKKKLAEFGVELLDVRFKRINYNSGVATKIYERMISERRQIAERFRSEGAGEAARIMGQRERELRQIESEAYRQTQAVMGKADAEATGIYAAAFNGTPVAREYYGFLRTLETYKLSLAEKTTIVLTTDSELLRYLRGPGAGPVASPDTPVPPAVPVTPPAATAPAVPPAPIERP
jgi:modulator of FtsH protease HflC